MNSIERKEGRERIENREYNTELIKNSERLFIELFSQIEKTDFFNLTDYETLISDDVSGRVPTLVVRKVMKKLSNEPISPDTYFISGGLQLDNTNKEKREEVVEFLKSRCQSDDVLIVTEYIETGRSIKKMANLVDKAKPDTFDVISLMIENLSTSNKLREYLSKNFKSKFLNGSVRKNKEDLKLWSKSGLITGVAKSEEYEIYPSKKIYEVSDEVTESKAKEKVRNIRQDIDVLSSFLVKSIEQDKMNG